MRRSPFLPTPALLPGRKVRLASSPHFSAFQQPYGLKQNRSVPPALPAAWGSLVKSILVGHANVAVPGPLPSVAPCGTALLAESGRSLQVFGTVRTPQAAVSFSSRGTPVPGSPGLASIKLPAAEALLRDAAAVLSFKPAANPSPEAGMPAAKHPARQPRRSAQASRRRDDRGVMLPAHAPLQRWRLRRGRDASLPKPGQEVGAWKTKLLQECVARSPSSPDRRGPRRRGPRQAGLRRHRAPPMDRPTWNAGGKQRGPQCLDNGRDDRGHGSRIRPDGRNQALAADRPGNGPRGSRTRPLNESALVLTPGKSGVIDMHGGGWALGRVPFFATLRTSPEPPPTRGLLAPSVSRYASRSWLPGPRRNGAAVRAHGFAVSHPHQTTSAGIGRAPTMQLTRHKRNRRLRRRNAPTCPLSRAPTRRRSTRRRLCHFRDRVSACQAQTVRSSCSAHWIVR